VAWNRFFPLSLPARLLGCAQLNRRVIMSGLLALLDDVAAIAKVAAASVDDIAAAAAKAGSKTAGVVIDDAAVTPKYVQGFEASRELPIIWRIARGSLINKLILLLPAAMLMSVFAPWLVAPLLILGGCYLCFEGAEKIVHVLRPHAHHGAGPDGSHDVGDPTHLEEEKVKGAIKTDFILSAEIMTIALSTIDSPSLVIQGITLAIVGIFITLAVYGAVAVIVKMDDVGLWLTQVGRTQAVKGLGRGIVKFMPVLLKLLTVVGTAAMLWVGGSILVHSAHEMGWHLPYETIKHIAHDYGASHGLLEWSITAVLDFVLGFLVGLVLIPLATKVLIPLFSRKAAH
jgi:predicted DNA repair protein MutK